MSKKWYSFFVVTDDQARTGETDNTSAPAGRDSAPAFSGTSAPQRASDVAPDAGADQPLAGPVSGSDDLDLVYSAAQIAAPPHGYTVLKVAEMLQSEHIRTLPADVKRKSIMVALDAAHVKVADIVEDAVRRDRALDTYERVLERHVEELRTKTDSENTQINEEIQARVAELRARIEANTQKLNGEVNEWLAWRTRKHQEETRIAEAIGYFVSENPISRSTSTAPDPVKGDTDAR